jgi:lipooligosaccharide transport system permease protein
MTKPLFPRVTWRALRAWQRNATVYGMIWKIAFLPPFIEPLLYLLAFGVGLSSLVGSISYRGMEISYLVFITPALIAVNIMYNSFFETTYASFVRMYYQKTFDAMMATPLSLEEIITGEIAWGATKSVVAAGIMLAVISPFGLVEYPHSLIIIPLALLGGFAFGSVGMFFTGIMPTIETFNLPVFLFITPMFLLSGTFFPLETFPAWGRALAYLLPLTHLSKLARSLTLGILEPGLLWNAAYLLVFCLVFYLLAVGRMRRRLIN